MRSRCLFQEPGREKLAGMQSTHTKHKVLRMHKGSHCSQGELHLQRHATSCNICVAALVWKADIKADLEYVQPPTNISFAAYAPVETGMQPTHMGSSPSAQRLTWLSQ